MFCHCSSDQIPKLPIIPFITVEIDHFMEDKNIDLSKKNEKDSSPAILFQANGNL